MNPTRSMRDTAHAGGKRTWTAVVIGALALAVLAVGALPGCSLLGTSRSAQDAESGRGVTNTTDGYSPGAPSKYAGASGGAVTEDALVAPGYADSTAGEAVGAPTAAQAATERLVVKSGSIRLRVDDITSVLTKIRSVTASFGGTIDDLQVSTSGDEPIYRPLASGESADVVPLAAYATVRVPSARVEEFTKRVASFGKVVRQSTNQTDVTQQHIDLSARLTNLRAEEARFRDFLKAAKNVKEMLLVETELERVRGEIESLQGQLDYLDRQIDFATLSIELVKPAPVVRPTGTDWGFGDALTNGIQGAAGVLRSIITISIAALPLAVVAIAVFFILRGVLRRRSARRAAAESEEPSSDEADETTE